MNSNNDETKFDDAKTVSLIVIGCGSRGYVYTLYALEKPKRLKVAAVCDPIKFRRDKLGNSFSLPNNLRFEDWKDIVKLDKFADAVLIATPDQLHAEPAIAFANKGYHILVEKPMAVSQDDCNRMVKAAKDNNVIFAVCHVLRYTPYNLKIKSLIDEGYVGKVLNIQHLEPVGFYHNAHSYVRGNWKRDDTSTFMLMAKSCHDIDLIHFFMNSKCKKVSSFGSLTHFNKEGKPKEAGNAKRCLDCSINNKCPYSAKTIYLTLYPYKRECLVPSKEPTIENVRESLETGQYGVCVYESDNNVVDQQVVNMEFEGGKTCSFSMVAFTEEICERKTRIHGSHGQLICDGHTIIWDDFKMGDKEIFKPEIVTNTKMTGHNCADYYLMRSFVYAVAKNDPTQILSGPDDTLLSHTLVFKAEQSRVENRVVIID
ncbi:putative oxidoreductase [Heterostelium album PN500]|uniref:Putative oxidoreductase n=1 Tax=Heterostelium pallidum (strain ATCC 26659 / Pp 5 / PN500) TaxID=670386 RepID=D3BEC7_HETP5|nr:putative oxidoreductase [Heterostelium album PN500]EFA80258.1 putative oxidoreductase [Heterostelium album PN500]|eukprot:XP_020432378.1 putative oxidoreductase [Heterostelium album PN500]